MTGRIGAGSPSAVALWILAVVVSLSFLRSARTLLIPIALAILISYALEPLVAWLQRHHIPRIAGVGCVLLVLLGISAGAAYTLKDDVLQVVEQLPEAAHRAREWVLSQLGSSAEAIREAGSEVGTIGQVPSGGVTAVFALAGHLVVIFFLVFFLLISGHHVRRRLIEIAGAHPDVANDRAHCR